MTLTIDQAEILVRKNKNYFWDGWTLLKFKANPRAYTNRNGSFKNGTWGFVTRIEANQEGKYVIDEFSGATRN